MTPLAITHYSATSALGAGRAAHLEALRAGRSGLSTVPFETCRIATWTGAVAGLDAPLPEPLAAWDCRNHRLAWAALQADGLREACADLRRQHGAERVGVFMGTSTSGVLQTELAYRELLEDRLPPWFDHRRTQNTYAIADFVRVALELDGPCLAISTACSSSAKVFAAAARAIEAGLCDAAVVGGADSLCLTTLYGFNALQLVSPEICRPADAARRGISIGEAAGYAILQRPRAAVGVGLLGYGESSDAHHMSAPEPEGRGAQAAMAAALARARLQPGDIDYINLHGTATPANDLAEDKGVCALFGTQTPRSSTKGWTGHTLGAAGIVEAVIALLAVEYGFMPQSLNTQAKDPQIAGNVLLAPRETPVRRVLSNSFGFGGSNCALVLGSLG